MTAPAINQTTDPRRLVGIVIGIAVVIALMLFVFAAPAINSGARDLPVAVSGPEPAVAQLTMMLDTNAPGVFEVTPFATAEDAAAAIMQREQVGGIGLSPEGVVIQTAAGAGTPYVATLKGMGAQLAASGQIVTYEELAPLTESDPAGAGIVALGLPLIFGGLASGAALVLAFRGSLRARAATALAVAVIGGLTATAILQFGFDSFQGSYWLTAAAVSAGILAASLTVMGLALLFGTPGIATGSVLLLFLSNPISGLAAGPAWLPAPWGAIGQFLPIGAAGTTIRSAAFFDGAGATQAWIVLAAWAVLGLAFAVVAAARTRKDDTVLQPN